MRSQAMANSIPPAVHTPSIAAIEIFGAQAMSIRIGFSNLGRLDQSMPAAVLLGNSSSSSRNPGPLMSLSSQRGAPVASSFRSAPAQKHGLPSGLGAPVMMNAM